MSTTQNVSGPRVGGRHAASATPLPRPPLSDRAEAAKVQTYEDICGYLGHQLEAFGLGSFKPEIAVGANNLVPNTLLTLVPHEAALHDLKTVVAEAAYLADKLGVPLGLNHNGNAAIVSPKGANVDMIVDFLKNGPPASAAAPAAAHIAPPVPAAPPPVTSTFTPPAATPPRAPEQRPVAMASERPAEMGALQQARLETTPSTYSPTFNRLYRRLVETFDLLSLSPNPSSTCIPSACITARHDPRSGASQLQFAEDVKFLSETLGVPVGMFLGSHPIQPKAGEPPHVVLERARTEASEGRFEEGLRTPFSPSDHVMTRGVTPEQMLVNGFIMGLELSNLQVAPPSEKVGMSNKAAVTLETKGRDVKKAFEEAITLANALQANVQLSVWKGTKGEKNLLIGPDAQVKDCMKGLNGHKPIGGEFGLW